MATPDPVGTSAGVTPLSHKAWTAHCALLLSAVLALAVLGVATGRLARRRLAVVATRAGPGLAGSGGDLLQRQVLERDPARPHAAHPASPAEGGQDPPHPQEQG